MHSVSAENYVFAMIEDKKFELFYVEANGITHRVARVKGYPLDQAGPEDGSAGRTLVMLLHGWPEGWYCWRHQLLALAEAGYHVCAPDMRGFGGTHAPDQQKDYAIEVICNDVLQVAKTLGFSQIIPVGHDLGSVVAWQLALRHPSHVVAVAALSVPYLGPEPEPPLTMLQRNRGIDRNCRETLFLLYGASPNAELKESRMFPQEARLLSNGLDGDDDDDESLLDARSSPGVWARLPRPKSLPEWLTPNDFDYFVQQFEQSGFAGGLHWYRSLDATWYATKNSVVGEKKVVEQPSMFLGGKNDHAIWGYFGGEEIALRGLKTACPNLKKCIVLPKCGHWIQQEDANRVSYEIDQFLKSIGVAAIQETEISDATESVVLSEMDCGVDLEQLGSIVNTKYETVLDAVVAFNYSSSSVGVVAQALKSVRKDDLPSADELCQLLSNEAGAALEYICLLKDDVSLKDLTRSEARLKCLNNKWVDEKVWFRWIERGWSSSTIISILEQRAIELPDHGVMNWINNKLNITHTLSYKVLWKQSGDVASLLRSYGIQRNECVMIAFPFGLDFLAALLGCMRAGAIACSVYPPNPNKMKEDLDVFNKQVEDAGAKYALTTAAFKALMMKNWLFGLKSKVTWLVSDWKIGFGSRFEVDFIPSPDDTAFIQYSSGSTGTPKGIVISHRSLLQNAHNSMVISGVTSYSPKNTEFVCVSWLPQYHDLGLIGFYIGVVYGAGKGIAFSPLDFLSDPIMWHGAVVKFRGNFTVGPNFSFGLLARRLKAQGNGHKRWTSITALACAAEPVDPVVMREATSVLGVPLSTLRIGYGLAEVGLVVGLGPFEVSEGVVACGEKNNGFPNVKVRVVDGGKQVEDGEIGEIWVQAPHIVANCYWKHPELSKATFHNRIDGQKGDWLSTGDLGKCVGNLFYVTGRKKEVIILNGRNFFPVDIERAVEKAYPASMRPGCMVAFQYSDTGVGLVAEVRKGVKQDSLPKPLDVCSVVAQATGTELEFVSLLKDHTVPKTTSGKLKRVATRDRCLKGEWPAHSVRLLWTRNIVKDKSLCIEPNAKIDGVTIPHFVPGARYGTQCPHAKVGLEAFYRENVGNDSYQYNGIDENATTAYEDIISELGCMQERLNKGDITRSFDLSSMRAIDTRLWSAVPGLCPHRFNLGQHARNHDINRPLVRAALSDLPSEFDMRKAARIFLHDKGDHLSTMDVTEFIMSIAVSTIFSPVDIEAEDLVQFLGRATDMMLRPHTMDSDGEVLKEKSQIVKQLMQGFEVSEELACLLVDSIFALGSSKIVLHCALAVFTGASKRHKFDAFELRHLRLDVGTFMSTKEDGDSKKDWWWTYASYDWSFDWYSNVGTGQVTLGGWVVPRSIVTACLRRDGGDWIWGHSWFHGDPVDELRFVQDHEGAIRKPNQSFTTNTLPLAQ